MGHWASEGLGGRSASNKVLSSFLRFSLLIAVAGQVMFGQATGSISGTISDATGSAVRGATITVKAPATGFSRSATSDEKGEY